MLCDRVCWPPLAPLHPSWSDKIVVMVDQVLDIGSALAAALRHQRQSQGDKKNISLGNLGKILSVF